VDINFDNPLAADKEVKFLFQSMALTLQDINILYEFFKSSLDQFTTS